MQNYADTYSQLEACLCVVLNCGFVLGFECGRSETPTLRPYGSECDTPEPRDLQAFRLTAVQNQNVTSTTTCARSSAYSENRFFEQLHS